MERGGLTIEGEALADVPAVVLGDEVLEVVVGVVDGADFVDVVDKVALGQAGQYRTVEISGRGGERRT